MSWDDKFEDICEKFGLPDSRIYIYRLLNGRNFVLNQRIKHIKIFITN